MKEKKILIRIAALLMMLAMVMSLAGCIVINQAPQDGGGTETTEPEPEPELEPEPEPEPQDGTGSDGGSELYTGDVSRAEVYTAYLKFMQGWEEEMLEPRMLDHVKTTALVDINGDGIEELFLYLPTMGDDGPPFLNVVTYENGMVTKLDYTYTTESSLTPGWTYSPADGMPGIIAGGGGAYAVFLSKDGKSLYMYSVPADEIVYYQTSKYSISGSARLNEEDQFEDQFDGPTQKDTYYSFGKDISEDAFRTKFKAAADDVGVVIMRNPMSDDFSIMKAVNSEPCYQKDYFDMEEYLKSF